MTQSLEVKKLPLFLLPFIFFPLIYLVGLGDTPFYSVGEPREAVVAQTMYINKSLLVPYRFDNELATKPPLLHWSMTAVATITGTMDELAARLPSALAALGALFAWFFFVRTVCNERLALLSVLILACFPEWYRHGTNARVDMLLSAAITLALISLYYWSKKPRFLSATLATCFLAAGVLCKGPVAVAVPGAILTIWLWYSGKLGVKSFLKLCTISTLSIVPLVLWYYLTYKHHGPEILEIFLSENILRFLGQMDTVENPHEHGIFYLFSTLLTGTAPWSLFALFALFYLKKKRGSIFSLESTSEKDFLVYCTVIVACFFCFYAIPSSKRAVYLLPAYPAVATLFAALFQELRIDHEHISKRISILVASVLLVLWVVVLVFRFGWIDLEPFVSREKDIITVEFISEVFFLHHVSPYQFLPLIILAATLVYLCYYKGIRLCGSAILLGLTSCLVRIEFLTPYATALSPRNFVQQEMKDHFLKELSIFNNRMYAEVFYARALDPNIELKHYEKSNEGKFILLSTDMKDELEEASDGKPVYQHRSPNPVEKPNRNIEIAILDTPSATAHK